MTRIYTREEALRRGAKPIAEEVEREERRELIESWFERKPPKRKKTRLTRTEKYAIKKLKKAKGIKRKGVVSAFGLSKARVRF